MFYGEEMTYRATLNSKINLDAVKKIKEIAMANETLDFTVILAEVAKEFNLTDTEANKTMLQAQMELARELL